MAGESIAERAKKDASGIAAMVVTGTWLAMLMLGFPSSIWLAFMLFGYIVVVPVVAILLEEEENERDRDREVAYSSTGPDEKREESALERLRRRYAEGELTDEQFERKLERLLETETLEDLEDRKRRIDSDGKTERETELE